MQYKLSVSQVQRFVEDEKLSDNKQAATCTDGFGYVWPRRKSNTDNRKFCRRIHT